MKLLANGCSMTHGQELVTDGYDPENTKHCYAYKIYQNYNMFDDYVNIAMPGVSNQHIVESTMDYLLTNGADNTFVLIGWTSPIRYTFTHNDHYIRFNIHQPPHKGDCIAGPEITEFHKQFRIHMNDPHDLSRHFFHQVNYLANYLEYAGIPYAMSYFFEEPGWSQSRRRTIVDHWPLKSNEPLVKDFGTPDPKYLFRYNIKPKAHWHALQVLEKQYKETLYASGRHPNERGHELIAKRLYPLVDKALNTI